MGKSSKFTYVFGVFLILNGSELSGKNLSKSTTSELKFKYTVDAFGGSSSKISGKWQVGRVSRKQYEIINMLYRETKTFVEMGTSSSAELLKFSNYGKLFEKNNQLATLVSQDHMRESLQIIHPRSKNRPCTPSYIEFYYLDEFDDRITPKDSISKSSRSEILKDGYKFAMLRPPFFLFRVNDATCKPTERNDIVSSFINKNNKKSAIYNLQSTVSYKTDEEKGIPKDLFKRVLKTKYVPNMYKTKTSSNKKEIHHKTPKIDHKNLSTVIKGQFTPNIPTTAYDRIKFFEIYDSDTHKSLTLVNNKMNIINNNYMQNEERVYLDEVDHDTANHDGHNITRFVKKHVNVNLIDGKNVILSGREVNVPKTIKESASTAKNNLTEHSRIAKWSEFPFVAVYVYEPTQVRCDSASISPHWLVASATCLYHHRKSKESNGRSAFVAYCGDNWRMPGRIGYVKRSFIHPRFQLHKKSKRYLYNIGVIQVTNSMANTCNGWEPVSLMSHQFAADRKGFFATAIGWGFNTRSYDSLYRTSDLPSYPLMKYEGLVYSASCPGNAKYRKVKRLNEESVKNVYCLSLPAYTKEENGTVYGGLLLIGGKLIALYLQEERRHVHSAQYTGIWRLIPWLLDVAREVEDLDPLALGI